MFQHVAVSKLHTLTGYFTLLVSYQNADFYT